MKTQIHCVTLPEARHHIALAGVTRLLLPMKPQPGRYFGRWSWNGLETPSRAVMLSAMRAWCPYRPGDRLALREPWASPRLNEFEYKLIGGDYHWQPPSKLYACRCFCRVVEVEPVRIAEVSEEAALKCGFQHPIPGISVLRSPAEQLRSLWRSQRRRTADDWAWSVQVEKEEKR